MQTLRKFNARNINKKTVIMIVGIFAVLISLVIGASYAEYKQEAEVTFINAKVADFRVFLSDITGTSTNNKIELSYTASGLNATTTCAFGTTKGTYNIEADSVDNNKCTKAGLSPNTPYYYKVCTKNNLKQEECKEGSINTKYDPPTLSAITATSTTNSIKLTYTTSGYVDGYACLYGTSSGNLTNSASMTLNECNITGLQSGTTYYYAVGISNNGGRATKYGSITTKLSPPTVSNITATSTQKTITLSYIEKGVISARTCKYGKTKGSYTEIAKNQTSTNCSIEGLNSGAKRYYQICVSNSEGENCYEGVASTLELISTVEIGDYISMTPTSTSYTITKDLTGHSSDQTINPSELNLWRVIKKNSDGTVDVVSQYVSSSRIHLSGAVGSMRVVGTLNRIAAQYTNNLYVASTRHLGYSNQVENCSDTNLYECSEDTGYVTDLNLVNTSVGTKVATLMSGVEEEYWLPSRKALNSGIRYIRYVKTDGNVSTSQVISTASSKYGASHSIRPVLTLKSGNGLASGSGEVDSPYTLLAP